MLCTSRFSSLSYIPAPYALSNLPFHRLPAPAQIYLFSLNIGSLISVPALLPALHSSLIRSLGRALQRPDAALVRLRREASSATSPDRGKDFERLREVIHVLLPARKKILDDFVMRYDALVWLECEVVRRNRPGNPSTLREQRRFRDRGLSSFLKLTTRGLVAQDEVALQTDVKACIETEGENADSNCSEGSPTVDVSDKVHESKETEPSNSEGRWVALSSTDIDEQDTSLGKESISASWLDDTASHASDRSLKGDWKDTEV